MTEHELLRDLVGAFAAGAGPEEARLDDAGLDAAARGADDRFWTALGDEAEYHGVAPLVGPALAAWSRRNPGRLPERVGLTFAVLAGRHRRASAERERCIDELIGAFAEAGLRMVLLKGACLGHLIYPAPALRPMADIDCLVAPAEVAKAALIARTHGFSFAERHVSRFAGRMHHLPSAQRSQNGFQISLEIHTDALAPDDGGSLALDSLSEPLRPFARGEAPGGLAFGHLDMLRHLTRHALEPARRLRLIHLLDIVRYQAIFGGEIDRARLAREFPALAVALEMIALVFSPAGQGFGTQQAGAPDGIGLGMTPLAELLASDAGLAAKLKALLAPPPWWLHAYYGVPAGKSLLPCRMVRHPAKVTRWVARRLLAVAVPAIGAAAATEGRRGT
ncbi:MAG: nucleotidyltransferase family protein [Xanthobacteraceae bacterium]